MKRPSVPSCDHLQPSERFHQRLQMYSVAASAAGVSLLALAQPAKGEIVYTSANVTISAHGLNTYALDLNHDGIADVVIHATWHESIDTSGGTSRILAKGLRGNAVAGYGSASAFPAGAPIGNGLKFAGRLMASLFTFIGTEFQFRGKFANVANRYLGIKFQINGETHYGWARFTVGGHALEAHLTGYAYESNANTSIIAGATDGATDASSSPSHDAPAFEAPAHSATLGALALGAPGLELWRRKQSTTTEVAN